MTNRDESLEKIVPAVLCRLLSGQLCQNVLDVIIFVDAKLDAPSEIAGKVISEVTREFMGLTCSMICGDRVEDDDLIMMNNVIDFGGD